MAVRHECLPAQAQSMCCPSVLWRDHPHGPCCRACLSWLRICCGLRQLILASVTNYGMSTSALIHCCCSVCGAGTGTSTAVCLCSARWRGSSCDVDSWAGSRPVCCKLSMLETLLQEPRKQDSVAMQHGAHETQTLHTSAQSPAQFTVHEMTTQLKSASTPAASLKHTPPHQDIHHL